MQKFSKLKIFPQDAKVDHNLPENPLPLEKINPISEEKDHPLKKEICDVAITHKV